MKGGVASVNQTIYHCHSCRYTFSAITPDRCPDCGAYAVRPATEEQIVNYERIRKEIEEEYRSCGQTVASDD